MNTRIREGRYCDPKVIRDQIGLMTVMAVSGGKWSSIRTSDGDAIGISLPCGTNRIVEVTLAFSDTYTVRRYRQVVRGERRGDDIIEYEAQDVYCDQISEVVYTASCWK
jgi:hypothetical protein